MEIPPCGREFNDFVLSFEHGVLENYCDSLRGFRLAAEIQWFCEKS
jgi:hypothetical protein